MRNRHEASDPTTRTLSGLRPVIPMISCGNSWLAEIGRSTGRAAAPMRKSYTISRHPMKPTPRYNALTSAHDFEAITRLSDAADLLADYISERPLPSYAPAFRLERYDDPAYRDLLAQWGDSGQL